MRKVRALLVSAVLSLLVLGTTQVASAGRLPEGCTKTRGTIHCTTEGKNKNWTTETSKKGSFSSSHEEETTNRNKGGNAPPGQND